MSFLGLPPTPSSIEIDKQIEKLKNNKVLSPLATENPLKVIENEKITLKRQKSTKKLEQIYQKIGNAYDEYKNHSGILSFVYRRSKIYELTDLFNNLADLSYSSVMDEDLAFEDNGIRKIIISLLNSGFPNYLRSAILIFITNVIRHKGSIMQEDFRNYGLPAILFDIMKNSDSELSYLCSKCLVFLTANDESYRDELINIFPIIEFEEIFSKNDEKTKKQLLKILNSYVQFPLDNNKVLDIIDVVSVHRKLYPKQFYRVMISVSCNYADLLVREKETLIEELLALLQDDPYKSSILDTLRTLLINCQSVIQIDAGQLFNLLDEKSQDLFSINLVKFIGDLFAKQNLFAPTEENIKKIINLIKDGKNRMKTAAIVALTQIINASESTNDIINIRDEFIKDDKLIEIIKDEISEEDPVLVRGVTFSLSRFIDSELNNSKLTISKIMEEFNGENIKDKLENLMYNSKSSEVSKAAEDFISKYSDSFGDLMVESSASFEAAKENALKENAEFNFDITSDLSEEQNIYVQLINCMLDSNMNYKELFSIFRSSETILDLSYVLNIIMYFIKIKPHQRKRFQDLYKLMEETYEMKTKVKFNNEEEDRLYEVIISDNVTDFVEMQPDPNERISIRKDDPVYYVRGDKAVTLLQIIAFYGAEKIFSKCISVINCDISTISPYACAGGNESIILFLEQNKLLSDDSLDLAVKFHNNELFRWLITSDKMGGISLEKAVEYYNDIVFLFILKNEISVTQQAVNKALLAASKTGNIEIFKYLIESYNADPNETDEEKKTPLHYACKNENYLTVKYLIEKCEINADAKDVNGKTPLHFASVNRTKRIARCLIKSEKVNRKAKDNMGRTPLHYASYVGNLSVIQYFIEKCGLDVDDTDKEGKTPLIIAAERNHEDAVKMLINDYDADTDAGVITPFFAAAQKGNLDIIKLFLEEYEANVEEIDDNRRTVLHYAAMNGHLDIVEYLVKEKQANTKAEDINRQTPLNLSIKYGKLDVSMFLNRE